MVRVSAQLSDFKFCFKEGKIENFENLSPETGLCTEKEISGSGGQLCMFEQNTIKKSAELQNTDLPGEESGKNSFDESDVKNSIKKILYKKAKGFVLSETVEEFGQDAYTGQNC